MQHFLLELVKHLCKEEVDPALAGKLVLDLLKRIGQSDPERAVASLFAVKGTTVLEGCARLRHEKHKRRQDEDLYLLEQIVQDML